MGAQAKSIRSRAGRRAALAALVVIGLAAPVWSAGSGAPTARINRLELGEAGFYDNTKVKVTGSAQAAGAAMAGSTSSRRSGCCLNRRQRVPESASASASASARSATRTARRRRCVRCGKSPSPASTIRPTATPIASRSPSSPPRSAAPNGGATASMSRGRSSRAPGRSKSGRAIASCSSRASRSRRARAAVGPIRRRSSRTHQ